MADWFDSEEYERRSSQAEPVVDPLGPTRGGLRVIRGGCFWDDADYARSAFRNWVRPRSRDVSLTFRVQLPAAPSFGE